jgi:proteasome alpha subunit
MGGQSEQIAGVLREGRRDDQPLDEALRLAVRGLASAGDGAARELTAAQLEVAVLERSRPRRAFRRISGAALERLLTA